VKHFWQIMGMYRMKWTMTRYMLMLTGQMIGKVMRNALFISRWGV